MSKNATMIVNGTIGQDSYVAGAVLTGVPDNQFADLERIGFVREATAEEVAAADAPIAPAILEPAHLEPAAEATAA